jgi:hypothetical protein
MTSAVDGATATATTRARYRTNRCHKNVKWRKDDDDLLIEVMSHDERPSYAYLGQVFPGKTGQQVAERWDKVLNPRLTKGSWTREEDQIITDFVRANGSKSWQKVSALLPGRIGKQCRERWRNHLDPSVDRSPWTADDDNRLRALHRELGSQ